MGSLKHQIGSWLARYLQKTVRVYTPFAVTDTARLASILRPADVLLVEGDQRVSLAIKYLTQSTWSHAALYVGALAGSQGDLIEADVACGVCAVDLDKYQGFNTRICRPLGLSSADAARVVGFACDRVGHSYDLKHVFDLLRYLLPQPPVPLRWRRRMLALGSGDPTQAICSTLIAQAFQSVRFPILPEVTTACVGLGGARIREQEILHIRHHSLFTPRDFDLSPYFQIVKPTIELKFDYRTLVWADTIDAPASDDESRLQGRIESD